MGTELDRPQALTLEVQALIVQALTEGNYLETACLASGITKHTFYYWKHLLEDGAEHAQVYTDFYDAVKSASAVSEQGALRDVRAGQPGWQGSAWFLERRFPKRWGKKDHLTVKSENVDMTKLTDAELEAIASGKSKG